MKPSFPTLALFIGLCSCAHGDTVTIEANGLQIHIDGVSKAAYGDVKTVIEEQTALTDDKIVTPPLADDLSFFLLQRYYELGFRDAVVTWDVADNAALLHVNEGLRYMVGAISYEGNTSQNESVLNDYLLRPTHEKLGTAGRNVPFVEADLKAGAELVQRYFQGQGFFDAVVAPPAFIAHPRTSTMDVSLKVREGKRYAIGAVLATGELEGRERDIEKLFKDFPGQPFNEVKVETIRKNIVGIYEQRGYYAAVVLTDINMARHPDGIVPVVYHVIPGPLFHIAEMNIDPHFSKGAQRLLRAGFKRTRGHIYSPSELELNTRRMLDTDVFARLNVKPGTGADNTLALDITGDESLRTTLTASLGYETFEGPFIGGEARQVNFMDTGDSVRIKAEYNTHGLNGGIKWLDPAIFESPYSLDVELAAQSLSVFDYERRTLSLRTTFKRQWNQRISSNLFAEGAINAAESDKLTKEELGLPEYQLGTVGAGILLDYRDSPVLPSRGWMASLTVASVSGNTNFLRSDIVFAYYQPITKKFRAAFSAKSSAIHYSGGVENLPIDLRVFNGGATSVRSFAEREMGPRSRAGDTPLGGLMSQTCSLELSYEIRPSLELALFGDAGNLSETVENPFSPPSGLRYAVGLGLRYKLPVGPLRIDYGVNPDRREGEPFGALHITFGFAF